MRSERNTNSYVFFYKVIHILRFFISCCIKLVFFLEFKIKVFFLSYNLRKRFFIKSVVIFDIDNTIADTWPSLLYKMDQATRLMNLPVFNGMASVVKSVNRIHTTKVIFLSHRPKKMTEVTKEWLKKNCLYSETSDIFLVSNVEHKYFFLKKISKLAGKNITYYDDLSYHHELGSIKFYEKVIRKVKKLPITYIGYEEINLINKIS